MARLPDVSSVALIKALKRLGWAVRAVEGSHYHMQKPGRKPITIPYHGSRSVKKGLLNHILKIAGVSREELADNL